LSSLVLRKRVGKGLSEFGFFDIAAKETSRAFTVFGPHFDIGVRNVRFWRNFVVKTVTDAYSATSNFDADSVLPKDNYGES
jgi:hypothetical protein